MSSDHYVEEDNLSVAWLRALRLATLRGRKEVAPLVVAVTRFNESGGFQEDATIRAALEAVLANEGKQNVHTVANTIFPTSLWNPTKPRQLLFDRFQRILGRVRRHRGNSRGTYFERMITGGSAGQENQLEFIIDTFLARTSVRRSVLQVGVFDPARDHSRAALLGFPCLQHVTFAPADEGLMVNAFYAMHYLVERAYGNYVGLCRLGQFVAHELGLPLVRMTCFAGIATCDVSKSKLRDLFHDD